MEACPADRADNSAFEGEEVQEAIITALDGDCRNWPITPDFMTRLIDVCDGQALSLFGNALALGLEGLRPVARYGMERVVLEFAIQTSEGSIRGTDIPVKAVVDALIDRLARNARQVEEHYCRRSNLPRAGRVRQRIERGADRETLERLARGICLGKAPE